jgi:hypothetical protein
MKTRWSIVLAALCLTLMALGSGRAAPADSVFGHGTVSTPAGVDLAFNAGAFTGARGTLEGDVVVGDSHVHVLYDVRSLFLFGSFGNARVSGVVTHSQDNSRFPVGRTDTFVFHDGRFGGVDAFAWSGFNDGLTFHPLRSGDIKIRF